MRNNKVKSVVTALVIVVLLLAFAVVIIVLGKRSLDEYKSQIGDLQGEINENKQIVYVASQDIHRGEMIDLESNVMTQEIYTGLDASSYLQDEMIGSVATVDINAYEPIMANMVSPLSITEDTREYEISVANIMVDQKEFDYVDVRIMFPNGEDYLLLTKKVVLDLRYDSCIFDTYMNEDEALRMASATIDAYTITGTRIYTTRYIEPNLQDEALPNYPVKASTLDLINSDPNITEKAAQTLNLSARLNLESRLNTLTEEQLEAVASGHNLTDTAQASVLTSGAYATNENEAYMANTYMDNEPTDANTGAADTDAPEENDFSDYDTE